jgi:hypothetical protein
MYLAIRGSTSVISWFISVESGDRRRAQCYPMTGSTSAPPPFGDTESWMIENLVE